jgi:integrase
VPKAHLTDISVRSLKHDGNRLTYWDTQLRGLGLRVGPNRKTWLVMRGDKRRRTTIGHYPAVTLAEARKKAMSLLGAEIEDVSTVRFTVALDKFFETHTSTLKGRSRTEVERLLNSHLLPHFQTRALAKITYEDVAQAIERIKAPSTAWHLFKDARTFFNWCVPRYLKHSPMSGMRSPSRYVARKRVLTDTELVSVWRAADRAGYPFGTILKLLILTGQRWGEIASLRRGYIDIKSRTITLPETKNGTRHTLPFGQMVSDILEAIPRLTTTDLLFPGRDPQKAWNGAGKAKWLLEWYPPIKPWTIHDLRRTASTGWASLRVPPHIVERLLNHRLGSIQTEGILSAVAEVYNRYAYLDEMREAVTKWERHIGSLLADQERLREFRAA